MSVSTAVSTGVGGGLGATLPSSPQPVELTGVIGFNGTVPNGLILHPGDQHIIYPLGSTIVVKHLLNGTQTFLQEGGHDRDVSCLTLSRSGRLLASGQITHMGFTAQVIVWNLETFSVVHRLVLHKGKVQDLAFSCDEKYLATLGGRDDNKVVMWSMETGEAICGASASNESALTIRFLHHDNCTFVTGGVYNLRVWSFDRANRKIKPQDCQVGQLKRIINSISIDANDEFMYCGTGTGDLMKVSLPHQLFKLSGPKKALQQGLTCTAITPQGHVLVGSGDGTIALLNKDTLQTIRKTQVQGSISSLVFNAARDHFFVSTSLCTMHLVKLDNFEMELRLTCHSGRINDLAFPYLYSELFATCSGSDIRIWNSRTLNELLRIQVPNVTCQCITFSPDGKAIISGWDDGKIRAFRPQSGTLMWVIHDAHVQGVTAIAATHSGKRLVSGGENGQVRVWSIEGSVQKLVASMKEHKSRVNCVRVSTSDEECVSASTDGSCIVWSLTRFIRLSCLFASTQFRSVVYLPDQSQLLTTGTDRKLAWWDHADAMPIRVLDGSESEVMNCLAISEDGDTFVTGGGDKLLKVYGYDAGECYFVGRGHSGEITCAAIAPNQQFIVSAGQEGAIFVWRMPPVPKFGATAAAAPASAALATTAIATGTASGLGSSGSSSASARRSSSSSANARSSASPSDNRRSSHSSASQTKSRQQQHASEEKEQFSASPSGSRTSHRGSSSVSQSRSSLLRRVA